VDTITEPIPHPGLIFSYVYRQSGTAYVVHQVGPPDRDGSRLSQSYKKKRQIPRRDGGDGVATVDPTNLPIMFPLLRRSQKHTRYNEDTTFNSRIDWGEVVDRTSNATD
jgi:hypothetical protein